MTKVCTKCKVEKPHSEFRKSTKGDKYGLHSWCYECNRAARRKDYADNPDKYAEWNRAWNAANPERRRELEKSRDMEKRRESARAWRENNPEKKRALDHNYRARKLSAVGVLTKDVIKRVLEVYGEICLSCGAVENIEIDHVVPLMLGGTNLFDNLQPLCKSCNSSKGARHSTDYRKICFFRNGALV